MTTEETVKNTVATFDVKGWGPWRLEPLSPPPFPACNNSEGFAADSHADEEDNKTTTADNEHNKFWSQDIFAVGYVFVTKLAFIEKHNQAFAWMQAKLALCFVAVLFAANLPCHRDNALTQYASHFWLPLSLTGLALYGVWVRHENVKLATKLSVQTTDQPIAIIMAGTTAYLAAYENHRIVITKRSLEDKENKAKHVTSGDRATSSSPTDAAVETRRIIHPHICDECLRQPIVGKPFRCTKSGLNLCAGCMASLELDSFAKKRAREMNIL